MPLPTEATIRFLAGRDQHHLFLLLSATGRGGTCVVSGRHLVGDDASLRPPTWTPIDTPPSSDASRSSRRPTAPEWIRHTTASHCRLYSYGTVETTRREPHLPRRASIHSSRQALSLSSFVSPPRHLSRGASSISEPSSSPPFAWAELAAIVAASYLLSVCETRPSSSAAPLQGPPTRTRVGQPVSLHGTVRDTS